MASIPNYRIKMVSQTMRLVSLFFLSTLLLSCKNAPELAFEKELYTVGAPDESVTISVNAENVSNGQIVNWDLTIVSSSCETEPSLSAQSSKIENKKAGVTVIGKRQECDVKVKATLASSPTVNATTTIRFLKPVYKLHFNEAAYTIDKSEGTVQATATLEGGFGDEKIIWGLGPFSYGEGGPHLSSTETKIENTDVSATVKAGVLGGESVLTATLAGDPTISASTAVHITLPVPKGFITAPTLPRMIWAEAKDYCEKKGGRLPRINNADTLAPIDRDNGMPIDGFISHNKTSWPAGVPSRIPNRNTFFWTSTKTPNLGSVYLVYMYDGKANSITSTLADKTPAEVLCVPK